MKPNAMFAALLGTVLLAWPAFSQKIDVRLDNLASRAKDHTVVDMDAPQIRALAAMGKEGEPKKGHERALALQGVEHLSVYTLEFEKDGEYADADLAPVRNQLQAPGWSRIVSTKEKGGSTEVYLMSREEKIAGLTVITAEPRKLTVVNIAGSAGLDQLGEFVNSRVRYDLSGAKSDPVPPAR